MTILVGFLIIFLTAAGQVLLKKGAMLNKSIFLNRYVITGYIFFVSVVLLSISLVNYLPLKYLAIIVSFSYPATLLFAAVFLGEELSRTRLLACAIIFLGGIVFNL